LARAGRQVADGRVAADRGRRHLRLLRPAAVPARAVGRPAGLPDRRPRGRDCRGRADPRRPRGTVGPPAVPPPHLGADRDRGARLSHPRADRPRPELLARRRPDVVWGLLFAASRPIRQTYLNGLIPSRQRATILSFDSMMSSTGGVWAQPVLGRAADVWGYAPSYLLGAAVSAAALPCLALSRRQ